MGKYCVNCGNKLQPGSRFCTSCGKAVLSDPEPTSAPPVSQVQHVEEYQSVEEHQPGEQYQPGDEFPLVQEHRYDNQEANMPGDIGTESRQNKSKKSGSKISIVLALLFFSQSVIVLLFGWPGYFFGVEKDVKFHESEIVDGIYQSQGITVDFQNNPDIRSFGIAKTEKANEEEGTVSDTYEFEFETVPQESITMSIPAPKDFTLGADEMLYLDVGVSVTGDAGEVFMVYDFIKAEVSYEMLTAEFVPAHYSDPVNTVYTSGIPIDKRTHADKFRFQAAYTVKTGKDSTGGHFKLIFDNVRTKTSVSDEQVSELLSRMEQVYSQMDSLGFDMSARTSWPMEIYTKQFAKDKKTNIEMDGQYVMKPWGINYSHININRNLFENYSPDQIIAIFGHEFTHFVYNCKVPLGKQLKWLNEGMATYFEDYFGGKPEYSARFPEIFEGIYPASDSGSAGYARPSVINYWVENNDSIAGGDSFTPKSKMSGLIELLSSGGYVKVDRWHNWITACLKDPSKYAVDFYTKLVLCDESVWGDKGGLLPYRMYQVIASPKEELGTWDKIKNLFGKYTEMNTDAELNRKFAEMKLSADEVASEGGQDFSVKVPGYGARIVALSMTEREQEQLEEDGTLSISAGGGEILVLFKIRSKKVETQQGTNLSLPEFSKTLKDKYCYLVLLVNTTNKAKDTSFTVRMKAEKDDAEDDEYVLLTIDDVVGTYREENGEDSISIQKSGDDLMMEGTLLHYTPKYGAGSATATVYESDYKIDLSFTFNVEGDGIILYPYTEVNDVEVRAGERYYKID
jgi:hypothetical protein